uniref:Uncharacterized protein n=1 Tax=Acrobeloides nanus TaxID=290746 RepID=A0A914CL63_9BILA
MDGNAWELVEEEPKKERQRQSRSPSKDRQSKLSRASETRFEFAGQEVDAEELSMIIDEQIKKESERRTQRGKSPAVESLRKIGRIVLEKVGVKKKKDDSVLLGKSRELETVPLERYCKKPIVYSMEDREDLLMPRVLSSDLLKDHRTGLKEKCSYLFRSGEDEHFVDVMVGSKPPERVHIYDQYCPVHGSKRRLTRRRLVDMHSFVNSVDTADHEQLSPILYSQAYIAKVMRKRKRANLSGAEKIRVEKSKHKIRINLWIISVAFLFLFTAFHGLQNLQTTVNGQMGADSLCALYISMAISSLFIPTFILNRIGSKLTLVTSMGIYILYMVANFLPKYYSLIPASILVGVASSCLWAANCVYITESGSKFARLNVEAQNVVIVRFFGYFFMVVHLGQVIGNILSSVIFISSTPATIEPEDRVDRTCGYGFSENISMLSPRAQQNLEHPSESIYRSVVGVDLCCAIVAMMIVALFLNSLRKDELE